MHGYVGVGQLWSTHTGLMAQNGYVLVAEKQQGNSKRDKQYSSVWLHI